MLYIIAFVVSCAAGIIIRIERVFHFRRLFIRLCYDVQIHHPDRFTNHGWEFFKNELPPAGKMLLSLKPLHLSRWVDRGALVNLMSSLPEHYKFPKGLNI
jgi:hypothetical protein